MEKSSTGEKPAGVHEFDTPYGHLRFTPENTVIEYYPDAGHLNHIRHKTGKTGRGFLRIFNPKPETIIILLEENYPLSLRKPSEEFEEEFIRTETLELETSTGVPEELLTKGE